MWDLYRYWAILFDFDFTYLYAQVRLGCLLFHYLISIQVYFKLRAYHCIWHEIFNPIGVQLSIINSLHIIKLIVSLDQSAIWSFVEWLPNCDGSSRLTLLSLTDKFQTSKRFSFQLWVIWNIWRIMTTTQLLSMACW